MRGAPVCLDVKTERTGVTTREEITDMREERLCMCGPDMHACVVCVHMFAWEPGGGELELSGFRLTFNTKFSRSPNQMRVFPTSLANAPRETNLVSYIPVHTNSRRVAARYYVISLEITIDMVPKISGDQYMCFLFIRKRS